MIECYIGVSGSGKTTAIIERMQKLQKEGKSIGGIVTWGDFKEGKRHSFWVEDVTTNIRMLVAQRGMKSLLCQGPFGFSLDAIAFGNSSIQKAIDSCLDVIIIDEIGPLELRQQGWFSSLRNLSQAVASHILFTSRPTTFNSICDNFFCEKEVHKIELGT